MQQFSLSANIEEGFAHEAQYIATPNARQVAEDIIRGFNSGVHAFTVIGSYGTGKSSFLLALESDLKKDSGHKLFKPSQISPKEFEVLKVVGDYQSLPHLLAQALSAPNSADHVMDVLRKQYEAIRARGHFWVILIDEFGKVLEHAANHSPERELYFMQKLAEFANVPTRDILLVTTLHQNFNAYARKLSPLQKQEWTKVKGRFQELVFVEPVEQLLFLAAKQVNSQQLFPSETKRKVHALTSLAQHTGFVSTGFTTETAESLMPLEPFSAYVITQAIQRYGQNDRSLFSFLNARGRNSIRDFQGSIYHLPCCFDYIYYNFYSYLKEANADSMQWSSMLMATERVEGLPWESQAELVDAIKLVKAIGLLNLFGNASFRMKHHELASYAETAIGISHAKKLINRLEQFKVIRYASYRSRYILFEGTDINIEEEVRKAGLVVGRPQNYVDALRSYCFKKVAPVKACYFQRGTPRYFEYEVLGEGIDQEPTGDTDGYIQLVFSSSKNALEDTQKLSAQCQNAIIFAYFGNTDELVHHLHEIEKYKYVLHHVLRDNSDKVAINEIGHLMEHEMVTLNKAISDSLFSYDGTVTWFFKGQEKRLRSLREFNQLLSEVCNDVYSKTPVMNNELFNKHKLSSSISSAKGKFLQALLNQSHEADFGFPKDKFPPEKTIYYSLLKDTGLHANGEFSDAPTSDGIMPLWNACEGFLVSTTSKPRKISDLIKKLSSRPYKLKQGFLDFWIPTYLFLKKQDYSLYGANGAYIPNISMEFFELLQKHPEDYLIKAFDVSGVRMEIFNQYRKFLNVKELDGIKSNDFIETIKPFFFFYNKRLNDYAKHTHKLNHEQSIRFRDTLAKAKDPEKAFFEDIPEALGYDREALQDPAKVQEFCYVINRAVKELRTCYTDLIDRVESRLLEKLGIEDHEYTHYVAIIQQRLGHVKEYLLTDRLKEFYRHAMSQFESRTEWYQSICYTALEQPLERLRDEQEEMLTERLTNLFRECEKYADISRLASNEQDEVYAFDLVSTEGGNLHSQTFRLPESEKPQSSELERSINRILESTGDENLAVCTLLKILNKRLGK